MPRNELNVLYPRAFPLGAVLRGFRLSRSELFSIPSAP